MRLTAYQSSHSTALRCAQYRQASDPPVVPSITFITDRARERDWVPKSKCQTLELHACNISPKSSLLLKKLMTLQLVKICASIYATLEGWTLPHERFM